MSQAAKERIDASKLVDLPVKVDTALQSDEAISVRLSSMDKEVVYTGAVKAQTGTQKLTVPVAPGQYTVQTTGFIEKGTVYAVKAAAMLTVVDDGSTNLQLKTQRGANLKVHGFPGFSVEGIGDQADCSASDFVNARTLPLFQYAGFDGAGDSSQYLSDDPATMTTIQEASDEEQKLGTHNQVLPIMISYTCKLSTGDVFHQLQNKDSLAHGFGNLILSLEVAKKHGKQEAPAGYIVNPDFLGYCQLGLTGVPLDTAYRMPVLEPLRMALGHMEIEECIPNSITDTLGGYVLAVNWIFRTVAKEVTFGWQVSLWGVSSSEWIYSTEVVPAEVAMKTADYIRSLGVYDGQNRPDFLAIDPCEANDFTQTANRNGHSYGPYEWRRFLEFCSELSLELQAPVMPLQIPASHTPLVSDQFNDLKSEHWGTGGSYIMGDDGVNLDHQDINPEIQAIKTSPPTNAEIGNDIFVPGQPFDPTSSAYKDLPLRGIFAVQLGGGSTTGILSSTGPTRPWTQDQLKKHMADPISLVDDRSANE